MSSYRSVSDLLEKLQDSDSQIEHEIWDRYIAQLVQLAKRKLSHQPQRVIDGEDIAVSAFDAFFRGAKQGRFKQLENRDDLWQILAMLAERRAFTAMRKEHAAIRGGGQVRGESALHENIPGVGNPNAGSIESAPIDEPSDLLVENFTLEVQELLADLSDEPQRLIAVRRLEGYSIKEIAEELGISSRAVERKLEVIRKRWHNMRPLD